MVFSLYSQDIPAWLQPLDRAALAILFPLALAILISGLDDLVVDLAWAWTWLRSKLRPAASLYPPGPRQLEAAPRQSIAILVPCWQEHDVIAQMLEHNFAALRYTGYHIFTGCYPNDQPTCDAVASVAQRFPNVHLALCPHDGPTSKADCLNWIYQNLLLFEDHNGQRFDIVVTHDAEDLIHPDELTWINYYAARYDFIQTPVLALPTPLHEITHGVYCDEFAEYHTRDMNVRAVLGGFLPSSGVGTAYRRHALDRLAAASSNRIFEPEALTEDYENGLRLFRLGCSQAFVPISVRGPARQRDVMATREYFPRTWSSAYRQRTRWVTGIALQGWQRFGWSGKPGEIYWLWRDRKGLLANPLSLLANTLFFYGLATALWTRASAQAISLSLATSVLLVLRTSVRMACCARIYGWRFALGSPIRAIYGNALNSAATFSALARYANARIHRRPLRWLKTPHAYPNRMALVSARRKLGEILLGSGYLGADQLQSALTALPPGTRLGEYLLASDLLSEPLLYEALSLQQGLPVAHIEPGDVRPQIARALPEQVLKQWRVLPFKVAGSRLHVAGPEPLSSELHTTLQQFTSLEIRYHLMTPSNYRSLMESLF